jgi:hypothetical protein
MFAYVVRAGRQMFAYRVTKIAKGWLIGLYFFEHYTSQTAHPVELAA